MIVHGETYIVDEVEVMGMTFYPKRGPFLSVRTKMGSTIVIAQLKGAAAEDRYSYLAKGQIVKFTGQLVGWLFKQQSDFTEKLAFITIRTDDIMILKGVSGDRINSRP